MVGLSRPIRACAREADDGGKEEDTDAWPPGRGSTSVTTLQARRSAAPRQARNVSTRDRAGPLHPARARSATADRPAPPDLAGAAAAQKFTAHGSGQTHPA